MINLTGITSNDSPAPASFISYARGAARMDHMLVSPATLPHITDHQVLTHLAGSDHYPIQLQLDLQASPPPPRSKWQEHYKYRQIMPSQDPATIYRYQQLISDQQTWDGFCQLANDSSSTPDDLLDAFKMSIFTAAMTAGYRTKLMGLPKPAVSRTHSRYKAWHDGLCKQLQQEIKTLLQLQHIPEKAAELKLKQQEYRQRIKHLLRKHRAEHSRQQLQQWRNNRNTFWQAYRAHSSACPFPPTYRNSQPLQCQDEQLCPSSILSSRAAASTTTTWHYRHHLYSPICSSYHWCNQANGPYHCLWHRWHPTYTAAP